MKAIVLGGCGFLGLSLVTYLKEQADISKILVTDIREDRLKELLAWLDDKKFSAKVLDINDYNAVVEAIKGYDVVLNVAYSGEKLPVAKAAPAGPPVRAVGKLKGLITSQTPYGLSTDTFLAV